MKETYVVKFKKHAEMAQKATRTSQYKAAAAYLYGDASTFQYDCTFNSELDGENSQGQILAIELEKVCLNVLNAETIDVAIFCSALSESVKNIVAFLES